MELFTNLISAIVGGIIATFLKTLLEKERRLK